MFVTMRLYGINQEDDDLNILQNLKKKRERE
jgi:hypothetical protein